MMKRNRMSRLGLFVVVVWLVAFAANAWADTEPETSTTRYEPFINLSYHYYSTNVADEDVLEVMDDTEGQSYSITAGVRNQYGKHHIGAAIEYSDIYTTYMMGFRAVDYVYKTSERYSFGAFFGAASLDSGLPQNGYYMGLSASALELVGGFDLTLEFRYASGLARDKRLPSDLPDTKPDAFLDINILALGFTRRF